MRRYSILAAVVFAIGIFATGHRPAALPSVVEEVDTTGVPVKMTGCYDVEPEYFGGSEGWFKYLQKNCHYPEEASEKGIVGKVVIRFVVSKTGAVTNVEVVSGPDSGGLREEAVRVIEHCGPWKPGMLNGLAVDVYKVQPFWFGCEDSTREPVDTSKFLPARPAVERRLRRGTTPL